ncbi:MAG: hypothetical protein IKI37_00750 [Oscillospiraceae bacterium]|nr:hypothetical protein [Oscillospiraceae bacterium]
MKAELIDENMQIAFDEKDNADLKEDAESVLKAVFERLSGNDSMAIQQNELVNSQMMIMNCNAEQMIAVIKKYLEDFQAEIVFVGENKKAKEVIVSVRAETEQKSGVYEIQEDFSLLYSKLNDNPLIARILKALK